MEPEDLDQRLKQYSLALIRLFGSMPMSKEEVRIIGRQFLRSGTSVGAQRREARRARSKAEFLSKMEGALQELDETDYWLDLAEAAGLCRSPELGIVRDETRQLLAIFITIINNAKRNDG